jgi:hypothetical protein
MTIGGTNQEVIARTYYLGGSARPSLPQVPSQDFKGLLCDPQQMGRMILFYKLNEQVMPLKTLSLFAALRSRLSACRSRAQSWRERV